MVELIGDSVGEGMDRIVANGSLVEERIRAAAGEAQQTLQVVVESVTSKFERELSDRQAKLESLVDKVPSMTLAFNEATDRIAGAITSAGQSVEARFDSFRDEFARALQARADEMGGISGKTIAELEAGFEKNVRALRTQVDRMLEAVSNSITEGGRDLSKLAEEVGANAETYRLTIDEQIAAMNGSVDQRLDMIVPLFSDGAKFITAAIEQQARGIADDVAKSVTGFSVGLQKEVDAFRIALEAQEKAGVRAAEEQLKKTILHFNENHQRIETSLTSRISLLELTIAEFTSKFDGMNIDIEEGLSKASRDAIISIGLHTELVLESVQEQINKIEVLLGPGNENLASLPADLREVVRAIEQKSARAESAISAEADKFAEAMNSVADKLVNAVQSNVDASEEVMLARVQALSASLEKILERVYAGLELRAGKFSVVMSRHASEINQSLSAAVGSRTTTKID